MTWTTADLTRLAFSAECRELSDLARAFVPTTSDGHTRPGELLQEALRLRSSVDELVRLAVCVERARGASWNEVGAALEITRQSAHERYAAAVEELADGILFPLREGVDGAPGWWACPDGLEDPPRTAASLDAWELRHRERTDPGRGEEAVSGGLGQSKWRAADAIGLTTRLAKRIVDRDLPPGVSERTARRMLLEAKRQAFDFVANEPGAEAADVRSVAAEVFEELTAWHMTDVRERLGHVAYSDTEAFITFDGRPVQLLLRTDDQVDDEARGWFLWNVGDQSSTVSLAGPRLPAGLHASLLAASGLCGGGDLVADLQSDAPAAIAAALDCVCHTIATDSAKGYPPFARGGIAGPASDAE